MSPGGNYLVVNKLLEYLKALPIQTLENFIQTSSQAYALGKDIHNQRLKCKKYFWTVKQLLEIIEGQTPYDMHREFMFSPVISKQTHLPLLLSTFQLIKQTVTSIEISVTMNYMALFEIYNGIAKDTVNLQNLELTVQINEFSKIPKRNASKWSLSLPNTDLTVSKTIKNLSLNISGSGFLICRGLAKTFIMILFNWARSIQFLSLRAPGFPHFISWMHSYIVPRQNSLFPNLKCYNTSLLFVHNGALDNIHEDDFQILEKMPRKSLQICQETCSTDLKNVLSNIMHNTSELSLSIDDIKLCSNMWIPRIFPPNCLKMTFTRLQTLELVNWKNKLDWLKDVPALENLNLLNPDLQCMISIKPNHSNLISWVKGLHESSSRLRSVVIISSVPIIGTQSQRYHIKECNIMLTVLTLARSLTNGTHPTYLFGFRLNSQNW